VKFPGPTRRRRGDPSPMPIFTRRENRRSFFVTRFTYVLRNERLTFWLAVARKGKRPSLDQPEDLSAGPARTAAAAGLAAASAIRTTLAAAGIAKLLFFVFLVLFVISLFTHLSRRGSGV
jgi:uncharacterized membrane protein YtjA (UPF0391 family)